MTRHTIRKRILDNIDKIDPNKTWKENAKALGINYNTFRREIARIRRERPLIISRPRLTAKEKIIDYSDKLDPYKSLKENAKRLGMNYNTFRRALAQLRKEGKLVLPKIRKQTARERILANQNKIDPRKSLKENAKALGMDYNTFRREMSRLEKEGYFIKEAPGRYAGAQHFIEKKIDEEEELVKGMDYMEMKLYMGNYNKNYSIIRKKRWHQLWQIWREAHEDEFY